MPEKSLAYQLIEEAIKNQSKTLDLGNCGLTDESPELKLLAECTFLEKLNLGKYVSMEEFWIESKNKGSRNLFHTILSILPNSLQILYLCESGIRNIENLENLKNLSQLYLSDNQISEIENLDKLTNLSLLDLGSNGISKIENLDNLSNLRQLNLSYNRISEIENLDQLPNLSQLDLSVNQISKIENLDHLSNLSQLYLGKNQISKIENLSMLNKLNELHLWDNQIQDVLPLKNLINQLDIIDLSNNPLEKLNFTEYNKIDIWKSYFNDLEKTETIKVPISYIKVNIIGDGRIGKSQFINFLSNKTLKKGEDETPGVKTILRKFDKCTLSLWDFGGQNYYHGSHRIMIREQDVNVVMWSRFRKKSNTDEPFRGYNYWLGTAQAFSTEADKNDIFLIQSVWNDLEQANIEKLDKTLTEDSTAIVNQEDMQDYAICPDHIFALDVFEAEKKNKKWKRSWDNFNEILQDYVEAKLKNKDKIEESLSNLIKELAKVKLIREFILTEDEFFDKYRHICDPAKEDRKYWLAILEFTGVLLYLKEIDSLNKKIILQPYRLSEYLHEKLDLNKSNQGKLDLGEIKTAFGSDSDDMIHIMEHYNLFFLDAKDKTIYVFPQYLSDENTAFKKALLDLVPYTFSLTFPDYFHEGRFFEFMSEYGQFAIDQSSYWKYGILFQKPDETSITDDSEEKTNKNPKAIVYYDRLNMTITVHIEDKKGKAELAKELFYQFAYKEKIYIDYREPITTDGVGFNFDFNETEVKYKKGRSHRDKILNYDFHRNLQLSTSYENRYDALKTMINTLKSHYFGYNLKTQRQEALDLMTLNLLDRGDKKKHRVFFSYSHKDEVYRDELEVHFANLKRSGYIETWHDRKIIPGEEWDNKIEEQILQADIVLLLVSSDLINSDYIWHKELELLKSDSFNGKIIPILLRPCDVLHIDFMAKQGIPRDQKGKTGWICSNLWFSRDEAYLEIVNELRNVFNLDLNSRKEYS